MRTSPSTIFTQSEKKLSGVDWHWIIKLTDGTDTWYFGDTEMKLSEGFVYGLLDTNFVINTSFDPLTKSWMIGSVALSLRNSRYKKDTSSDWVRPSDELTGIRGNAATLYVIVGPGERSTSLASYALDYFNGYVVERPTYDANSLKITIHDTSKYLHKVLPQNLVGSVFTSAPSTTINRKIPLMYGEYSIVGDYNDTFDYTGTGLALGERTNIDNEAADYVFGDHVGYRVDAMWTDCDHTPSEPARYDTPTLSADDSGHITGIAGGTMWTYLMCVDNDDTGYTTTSGYASPLNVTRVWDRDESSFATGEDSIDILATTTLYHHSTYHLEQWPEVPCRECFVCYKIRALSATTPPTSLGALVDIENDTAIVSGATTAAITTTATWYTSSCAVATINAYDGYPDAVRLTAGNDVSSLCDNTADNLFYVGIYDLFIRCEIDSEPKDQAFLDGAGREYGSWITEHSASSYSATDAIEDPAGIIESILIDELGLLHTDMDKDSFDAAENSSVKARLNLHSDNEMMSDQAIRKISEQSTFAFCFTAEGKARLIPLNDSSPTTNLTVHFSQIKDGDISISKSNFIVNKLVVNSRYQQEYGNIYRDTDTYDDATSQGSSGLNMILKYTANWQNICGTSASHVANHLVYASTGIWSNEHLVVNFELKGLVGVRLVLGDWIAFDAESMDGHLLCDGATWASKQFLITNIKQGAYSTKIEAIKLY